MFLPIGGVWWYGERILLALNQEPDLAEHAGKHMSNKVGSEIEIIASRVKSTQPYINITFDHDE